MFLSSWWLTLSHLDHGVHRLSRNFPWIGGWYLTSPSQRIFKSSMFNFVEKHVVRQKCHEVCHRKLKSRLNFYHVGSDVKLYPDLVSCLLTLQVEFGTPDYFSENPKLGCRLPSFFLPLQGGQSTTTMGSATTSIEMRAVTVGQKLIVNAIRSASG